MNFFLESFGCNTIDVMYYYDYFVIILRFFVFKVVLYAKCFLKSLFIKILNYHNSYLLKNYFSPFSVKNTSFIKDK